MSTDIVDLTALGEDFVTDPYPVYAELRARGPVHRVRTRDGEMWLVVGYEEARAALADQRLAKDWHGLTGGAFEDAGYGAGADPHGGDDAYGGGGYGGGAEPYGGGADACGSGAEPYGGEAVVTVGRNMLESDPPRHTRLRKLVAREFTARRVAALRPRVEAITEELIDAMLPAGRADLVASFAFPLPITVICELLGVPDLDRETFSGWTRAILGDDDGAAVTGAGTEAGTEAGAGAGTGADVGATVAEAEARMGAYLGELIEDKRCSGPREDLLSALIQARYEDGDRLSPSELVGMAFLLLVAGHETTVGLIANATLALLRHPDQLAALRADMDGLLPGAIEEALRWDGPVETATYRFTRDAYPIGGTVVPPGSVVVVALASADRDAARYPRPDTFDIRRSTQGHLAFGHGIHYCLGAPLARLEGAVALRALLTRCPALALDAPVPAYRTALLMRGPRALPVRF